MLADIFYYELDDQCCQTYDCIRLYPTTDNSCSVNLMSKPQWSSKLNLREDSIMSCSILNWEHVLFSNNTLISVNNLANNIKN